MQHAGGVAAARTAQRGNGNDTGGGSRCRPVGPRLRASVALAMRWPRARAHERVISCRKTAIQSRHALLPRSLQPACRPMGIAELSRKRGQLGEAKRQRVVGIRHSIRCAGLLRLHAWSSLKSPKRLCAREQHTSTNGVYVRACEPLDGCTMDRLTHEHARAHPCTRRGFKSTRRHMRARAVAHTQRARTRAAGVQAPPRARRQPWTASRRTPCQALRVHPGSPFAGAKKGTWCAAGGREPRRSVRGRVPAGPYLTSPQTETPETQRRCEHLSTRRRP